MYEQPDPYYNQVQPISQQDMAAEPYGITDQSTSDLAKYILNSKDVIEEIGHTLNGEELTENGWERLNEPLMNKRGISEVKSLLHMYLPKNVTLANFDDEDVKMLIKEFQLNMIKLFFFEWQNFGMKKSKTMIIAESVAACVYANLTRAIGAGESKRLTLREKSSRIITNAPKKKFGFNMFQK